ncbi:uncharacterized protein KZ484_024248 [Pholidichthys leucotaenia]
MRNWTPLCLSSAVFLCLLTARTGRRHAFMRLTAVRWRMPASPSSFPSSLPPLPPSCHLLSSSAVKQQLLSVRSRLQSPSALLPGGSDPRTMTFLLVLSVLVLVVSAEASVGPSTNTSFCTESNECLEYELVCKTDEYEVRHYTPTRWVSTDAEAYFMGVGAAMAFRRLFQYITGANEGGVHMEMTAPVLVKIPEETKMWEPAIYTLNFPLPAAYQDKPPTPTNDKLYFTEMPEMDVYVRSYGGWMLSVTSRLHAHLLTKELERVGASYNHSYHYGVGYDSPLKLLNRHNEVWYVAEGEVVCVDPQEPTPAHTTRLTPTDPSADARSDPLPDTLSDAPSLTPSNLSLNSTSNSSSLLPSDTPTVPLSNAPPSPSSGQPAEAESTQSPMSAQILLDLQQPTNSSDPVSVSPSLEQSDGTLWKCSTHSSTDTPIGSHPEAESAEDH